MRAEGLFFVWREKGFVNWVKTCCGLVKGEDGDSALLRSG